MAIDIAAELRGVAIDISAGLNDMAINEAVTGLGCIAMDKAVGHGTRLEHGNCPGRRPEPDQRDQIGFAGLKWKFKQSQTKWSDICRNLDGSGNPKWTQDPRQTIWSGHRLKLNRSGDPK